ncbi:hypothetical protein QR680_007946 [Steinernema hermaphroditum]|uniref:Uncharacterized protein n=1 Tax=Steinernema hermaphroditum TaxID=289476 RepID=A0AA39IG73_9BILA|nr:hypothetical protein QR680_007946 [Steinernema hermaphroditum]
MIICDENLIPKKTNLVPRKKEFTIRGILYYFALCYLVLYYIGAAIFIYFFVLSPTRTARPVVPNNLKLVSGLNKYDEKFSKHFDYKLTSWIANLPKRTSDAQKSQELRGLLDDHHAEMESIAGGILDEFDDFREKQSYVFLSTAVLNNATEDEVWRFVEIYTRTMTFARARKLQNFTATLLVHPWKTSFPEFDNILTSTDRRVLDVINSLDMPNSLKSIAKKFWKSYSSAHIPGVKESCLVYRSNSETLDYEEILDRIRVAIMVQVTDCVPPDGVMCAMAEVVFYRFQEDFKVIILFQFIYHVLVAESCMLIFFLNKQFILMTVALIYLLLIVVFYALFFASMNAYSLTSNLFEKGRYRIFVVFRLVLAPLIFVTGIFLYFFLEYADFFKTHTYISIPLVYLWLFFYALEMVWMEYLAPEGTETLIPYEPLEDGFANT